MEFSGNSRKTTFWRTEVERGDDEDMMDVETTQRTVNISHMAEILLPRSHTHTKSCKDVMVCLRPAVSQKVFISTRNDEDTDIYMNGSSPEGGASPGGWILIRCSSRLSDSIS